MNKKKVLITAGSTCVAIDSVRVITNIFKGRLGIEIAKQFSIGGFDVTLLLGDSDLLLDKSLIKAVKIKRFKYYNELYELVLREIKHDYDIVIHSAAISDYQLADFKQGKIKSGKKQLILKFIPTPKIVDLFKKINPDLFLVMFKLEVDKDKDQLLSIAKKSKERARADIIVANDFRIMRHKHLAYIITDKNIITVRGKKNIAKTLFKLVYDRFK